MITVIVFGVWKFLMDQKTDVVLARSIIMMLMVFIQNINVLNCRSEKRTLFKESIFSNPIVLITIVGSFVLQIIMAEIPATAAFLKVTPLTYDVIIKLFILSLSVIVFFELYKLFGRIKRKKES